MSDDEMKIAIAEATEYIPERIGYWVRKDGKGCVAYSLHPEGFPLPDYLNDLNAGAEMRKALNEVRQIQFCNELSEVIRNDSPVADVTEFDRIHATARQRCIAFLKTLGLYVETPCTN
jgi:hypothetical protein